ncbi:MAG: DoxX family protein [Acidobacteriota bacterium]|nr:DoxX family protein [Acidobacteriota bacterium]
MISKLFNFEFFKKYKEYAPVFLRLLIGVFIIHGVQDNVFSYEHMKEFAAFLQQKNVPFPLPSAFLSAYAQMICGISILLGAFVRPFAILFIINFIAAVIIAHLGDGFRAMFPALMMIAAGFFFLFNGAGKLSVDELLERKNAGFDHGESVAGNIS